MAATKKSNLAIWEDLAVPPKDALKEIKGGRLAGKSDINPQWRMEAMTERFGPCGVGWKYEITRQWLECGAGNKVAAFVNVNVYIKQNGEWSEPIPGTGGSMFVAEENNKGPYTSDEAYKMATTDALSVAFKALGVGAAIYRGFNDTSKYAERNGNGGQTRSDAGHSAAERPRSAAPPDPNSERHLPTYEDCKRALSSAKTIAQLRDSWLYYYGAEDRTNFWSKLKPAHQQELKTLKERLKGKLQQGAAQG